MVWCLSFKYKSLNDLNLNHRLKQVEDIWVIHLLELAHEIHRVFVLLRIYIRDVNKDTHCQLL